MKRRPKIRDEFPGLCSLEEMEGTECVIDLNESGNVRMGAKEDLCYLRNECAVRRSAFCEEHLGASARWLQMAASRGGLIGAPSPPILPSELYQFQGPP